IPNMDEALNRVKYNSLAHMGFDPFVIARLIRKLIKVGSVVLKLGSGGLVYIDDYQEFRVRAHNPLACCDTVGAGDTLLASIAANIDKMPIKDVLHEAVIAAHLAVSKPGTQEVSRKDVELEKLRCHIPSVSPLNVQTVVSHLKKVSKQQS